MNVKSNDSLDALEKLLRQKPMTAASICKAMGITQSTLSRLWRQPGSSIITLGAARATYYAIARTIPGLDANLPVYRIGSDGKSSQFGLLRSLAAHWFAFTTLDGAPTFSEGLPYFLQDMRPQGFLGRLVPRQNQDLNLPEKITDWTDDHVLIYLVGRGDDVGGNLIVGDEALLRFMTSRTGSKEDIVGIKQTEAAYPLLADAAIRGESTGSSAGGEQPKFTAKIKTTKSDSLRHVIVKFSPPLSSPSGRRWADLLIAEHLAAQTLSDFGMLACTSRILAADERLFLEVERFDRNGKNGRAPMVSFAGLDCLLAMLDSTWSNIAQQLVDNGMLSNSELEKIRLADLFGALIGNTDRHPGNMAFAWDEQNKLSLLPIYDMLPMTYRPNNQGEVVVKVFSVEGLALQNLGLLPIALKMADTFWQSVLQHTDISAGFKVIADQHRQELRRLDDE